MFESIRLVWNLTFRCGRRCTHCAAAANKNTPEDVDTKFNILRAIMRSDLPVDLDFSGGDPWRAEGGLQLMQAASAVYGQEHISVSGTGVSILIQPQDIILSLASSYDFTYDQPWWYEDHVRKGYNLANLSALSLIRQLNIDTAAVIPITENMSSIQYQGDLIRGLHQALVPKINLLRLMPVGRNTKLIENDNAIADKFIKLLRACGFTGPITKNCAMTETCNGLSNTKLGLNPYGDLFWCIWASDLSVKKTDNPFYMGNLLEEPLLDILDRHREIAETLPRSCCHVLNFLQSPELYSHSSSSKAFNHSTLKAHP